MLCSLELEYVDLQIVPPQNQLCVVLNQICWPEGCTYSVDFDEVQPSGQHISMKTMVDLFWWCTAFGSTYLSEGHVWLILVRYVPHQNQSNIVCIGICWPEDCTSPKSVKQCVYCEMLTRRLYLIKISSALCSFGICWYFGETSPNTYNLRVNISDWAQRITDFGKVQSTGQHIPMNTTFNWFWLGTTFSLEYVDPKVVPH
jgi:hypothetical protein